MKAAKPNKDALTQAELKTALHYEPRTGVFTWIKRVSIRITIGKQAGKTSSFGYILIGIYGQRYLAHRLAWLYMHGNWPRGLIDHKDRNTSNNRIFNLREASFSENAHNTGRRKNNTSGAPGVSWNNVNKKWMAKICVNRKQQYLGSFDFIDEAETAYKNAQLAMHPAYCLVGAKFSRKPESRPSQSTRSES